MRKNNILCICLLLCISLCGCSREDITVSGAFGTGESVSESKVEESSESDEAKFAIKDDITLSEETDSDINVSLSSLQQAKINEIEQNLKSESLEVTKDSVLNLLNTDNFVDLSVSEKEHIATEIIDRISDLSTSETLSSELVYKYASSYETNEVVTDPEAPVRIYSESELESMHSEAESLYQQQQIAETFEFDD